MDDLLEGITSQDVTNAFVVIVLLCIAIYFLFKVAMVLGTRTCPECRSKRPLPLKNHKQWRCPDCKCIFDDQFA